MSSQQDRPELKRLWDELVLLHDMWDQYRSLFMTSQERVQLLNRSGRWFFSLVQRLMVERILLTMSRLADPPEIAGRRNLTFAVLLEDPRLGARPVLRKEIEAAVEKLKAATHSMRLHRNKVIAHLDRDVAMTPDENRLPGVTSEQIAEAIALMEHAYRQYGLQVHDTHYVFDLSALGGAEYLIKVLEDGHKWRREEQNRLRREVGLPPLENNVA